MTQKYFSKFPNLYYNNLLCRDITRRVKLDSNLKKNIQVFYPVELQAGFRADQLAGAYYEDSELDWLIYLTNEIVDPYYGWYLDEYNFNEFINTKYGSIEKAQERIKFYRNNWYEDSNEISPTYYSNTLANERKKYYEPVFGLGNKIISYRRKQVDWVTNTNRILQYDITLANSEVGFSNNEQVDIKLSGEIVGQGEVIVSNNSSLIVFNVSGNTSANSTATKIIIGEESGANATTDDVIILQENFSETESVFWSNVSFYDYEVELNESRKNIEVVDSSLVLEVTETIRRKLRS